jgi:mitogen-activated protein kinase 1/3
MLSGKPIFPGRDYHNQLTLILDVLGTPTLDEFYAISSRRSRDYIRSVLLFPLFVLVFRSWSWRNSS